MLVNEPHDQASSLRVDGGETSYPIDDAEWRIPDPHRLAYEYLRIADCDFHRPTSII